MAGNVFPRKSYEKVKIREAKSDPLA